MNDNFSIFDHIYHILKLDKEYIRFWCQQWKSGVIIFLNRVVHCSMGRKAHAGYLKIYFHQEVEGTSFWVLVKPIVSLSTSLAYVGVSIFKGEFNFSPPHGFLCRQELGSQMSLGTAEAFGIRKNQRSDHVVFPYFLTCLEVAAFRTCFGNYGIFKCIDSHCK